ncbi:MAG: hypothetical protein KF770_22970 [Anaerolineae bacterium]|nr:hypothetical protein [Anaerolineae bacterium]
MNKENRSIIVMSVLTLLGASCIIYFFANIGSHGISLHILQTYLLYFALLGLFAIALVFEVFVAKLFSDITFRPVEALNSRKALPYVFLLIWLFWWGYWAVNMFQSLGKLNWEACDAVAIYFPQSLLNERLLQKCQPTESLSVLVVSNSRDFDMASKNLLLAFRGTAVQLDIFTATFELSAAVVLCLFGGDVALILFAVIKGIGGWP